MHLCAEHKRSCPRPAEWRLREIAPRPLTEARGAQSFQPRGPEFLQKSILKQLVSSANSSSPTETWMGMCRDSSPGPKVVHRKRTSTMGMKPSGTDDP
jgi:hypothetical protein